MSISFKTRLDRVNSNVWDVALIIPKEQVAELVSKNVKRVLCTINEKETFHCALMHSGDGNYFINTNKEIRKKTGIEVGDEVTVDIKEDTSKYGMPLCDELKAAWEIDPEANEIFHSLTMGKQRSLIHIIGKPKSPEIRIKKALVMLEYLKNVNGNLDFKELNQAFKDANR